MFSMCAIKLKLDGKSLFASKVGAPDYLPEIVPCAVEMIHILHQSGLSRGSVPIH